MRRVAALALDVDRKAVGGRQHRAFLDHDRAQWLILRHMEREAGVDMRIFEDSLLDHHPCPARSPLFRRLEQHLHRAGEFISPPDQCPRQPKQDRRVGVVPAGMHQTVRLRSILDIVFFMDR
jgi:hypothetical protein